MLYISAAMQCLSVRPSVRHVRKRRSVMDHSVACNYTNVCLYLVRVHQMAPPQTEVADI